MQHIIQKVRILFKTQKTEISFLSWCKKSIFFFLTIVKAETVGDNTPPCHNAITLEDCWALLNSRLTQISPILWSPNRYSAQLLLHLSTLLPLFFLFLWDLLSVGRNIFPVSELAIFDSAGRREGGTESRQRQVKLTVVINNSFSVFSDPYEYTQYSLQNLTF